MTTIDVSWITNIAPILIFIVATILIFAGLKKLKLGINKATIIVGLILSLFLITLTDSIDFLMQLTTYTITLLFAIFLIFMLLTFTSGGSFRKPIHYIAFAIILVLAIVLTLNHFPSIITEYNSIIKHTKFIHNFLFIVFAITTIYIATKK
jgi:hypothetical protein